jgi:hypothetical protein
VWIRAERVQQGACPDASCNLIVAFPYSPLFDEAGDAHTQAALRFIVLVFSNPVHISCELHGTAFRKIQMSLEKFTHTYILIDQHV